MNIIKIGFTIIELMIVIGIIGILSIIGTAQYTSYIGRAQVTEAINILAGAKLASLDYEAQNGVFPPDIETLTLIYPIITNIQTETKYIGSITLPLVPGTPTPYVIRANFKSSGTHSRLRNRFIDFHKNTTTNKKWVCVPASNIPKDLLPENCKSTDPSIYN